MAVPAPTGRDAASSSLLRAAMWVAIAALVAAALICVVWVLLGGDDGIVGKAFLTVLLLAGFAGVAILEARLAPHRPAWFVLTSMVTWVVVLLIGALFIWLPEGEEFSFSGPARFLKYGLVVAVLALALLHVRLFLRAHVRYVTPFTRAVATVTVGLVALLAILLVVPLVLEEYVEFPALYWRITVAIAILAAVGTALLPLVRALFGPREPRVGRPLAGWPTYADGRTPLPVLPGGQPDWNAYYTGRPSLPASGYPTPPAPVTPTGPGHAPAQGWGAAGAPPLPPFGASPAAPARPAPPMPMPMPVPTQTPMPMPPSPAMPFAPAPASAPPLAARAHGWRGGQQTTDDVGEPTMQWAEDAGPRPPAGVRPPDVRRTGDA